MNELPLITHFEEDDERRSSGRIDARIGSGITVKLLGESSDKRIESEVTDYSSFGLGVEVRLHFAGEQQRFRVNEPVLLSFRIMGNEEHLQLPCRVTAVTNSASGALRVGLEFIAPVSADYSATTLALPETMALYGMIENPFLYDQTSVIHVKRISRQHIVVQSYDRSFALFPTMSVVFSLNLFGSQEPVHGRVVESRTIASGSEFVIKVEWMSLQTERDLVRYLLLLLDMEPFELRRIGFETTGLKDIVNYRFVRSKSEYVSVLGLRKITYSAVKKLKKDADLSDVSYWYDEHSRILGVWHHNRLIASVALLFGDGDQIPFEVQRHISPEDFKSLPPPSQMMEIVGLCMHHNYRKSDILIGIFQRMFQVMIASNRSYALASSDSYLWNIYESIGFQKTGIRYTIKKHRDLTLDVILIHRRVGAYGWSLDPMRWDEVWGGMAEYLEQQGRIPLSPRHLAVSPIYKLYVQSMRLLNPTDAKTDRLDKGSLAGIEALANNEMVRRIRAALGLEKKEERRDESGS